LYKHLPQQQVLKWKLRHLLAARILSTSGVLNEDQKVEDALSELGNLANLLTQTSLPNISASVPQLRGYC
jgi:monomeric isocitrate dehydrogenase